MSGTHSGRLTIFQSCALDDAKMTPAAFRVLAMLGSYSDGEGWCYPTQGTLAARLGVKRQAIGRQIKVLADLGYIQVRQQQRENGGKASCLYRLILDFTLPPERRQAAHDPEQDNHPMQPGVAGVCNPQMLHH